MATHRAFSDSQYEDERLTAVTESADGFDLRFDSMGIGLAKQYDDDPPHGVVPKVGDVVRCWGRGFGYPVRGMAFFDGAAGGEGWRVAYYRSEQEQQDHHAAWVLREQANRLAEFERSGRAELDAKYAALPAVFQHRIDKFRANNPDFRWKYEGYEMFTCEQAVVIADALKTPEALNAWRDLPYEAQRRAVPALSDDHSGNTFGAACSLAYWYLSLPENVVAMHGALAPLVGSEEYGCVPKGETEG